jgi:hypothetical protein
LQAVLEARPLKRHGFDDDDVEDVLDPARLAVSEADPALVIRLGAQQLPRVDFVVARLEGEIVIGPVGEAQSKRAKHRTSLDAATYRPVRGMNRVRLLLAASSFVLLLLLCPTAGGASTGPRVTVITDSVGGVLLWDGEANQILGQGFDLVVDPVVCRKLVKPGCESADPPLPSALDTVNQLGPTLGKIVVIDTGYNDTTAELAEGIDPLMRALLANGVEHVIWVDYVERLAVWANHNAVLAAAAEHWPQMIVADWNAVALPHNEWFVDAAHIDTTGGRALATFLHPFLVSACGSACVPVYCGLARTANGFDYVQATSLACDAARATVVAIERGQPGTWTCSRNTDTAVELTCIGGDSRIELLERSPVAATRAGNVVSLANWTFRMRGRSMQGRGVSGRWLTLGRAPWCIPDVPREVLLAFRLKPLTRNGGCFTVRG